MWWQDLLWGLWNGLTAWIVLVVHVFGGWDAHALYNAVRSGNWYDFGFLVGAGSPLLGLFGARRSSRLAGGQAKSGIGCASPVESKQKPKPDD